MSTHSEDKGVLCRVHRQWVKVRDTRVDQSVRVTEGVVKEESNEGIESAVRRIVTEKRG